jgi:hypothetical protein
MNDLTKKIKEELPEIVAFNQEIINGLEKGQKLTESSLIYFRESETNNIVYNPFLSKDGKRKVEPLEYYKLNDLIKLLQRYDEYNLGKYEKYKIKSDLTLKVETEIEDNIEPDKETMLFMFEKELRRFISETPWDVTEIGINDFEVKKNNK